MTRPSSPTSLGQPDKPLEGRYSARQRAIGMSGPGRRLARL